VSEPTSSLVKIKWRRMTRYLTGEVRISGYRTGDPPEAPPGYQGRHAGIANASTGEALPGPCESAEQTAGIRGHRNPVESGRESDGVIVPRISETTELRRREGPLL
jgi:hypothetical protein